MINYDFPQKVEEFVHRVGRTGRAGRKGESFTFFTYENKRNAHEFVEVNLILRLNNIFSY